MSDTTAIQSSDLSLPKAGKHSGFIYFYEGSGQYVGGIRAWIFLAPYILGALLLEPFRPEGSPPASGTEWLLFGVYLIAFPAFWKMVLRRFEQWEKRSDRSARAI